MSDHALSDDDSEPSLAHGLGRADHFLAPAREDWDRRLFECCHPIGRGILDRVMFGRPEVPLLLLRDTMHLTEAAARAAFERISERQLRRIFVALLTRLVLDRDDEIRVAPDLPELTAAQSRTVRRFVHSGVWAAADDGVLERYLGRIALGRLSLGQVMAFVVGSIVGGDAAAGSMLLGGSVAICAGWFDDARRAYGAAFLHVCERLEARAGRRPPDRFSLN